MDGELFIDVLNVQQFHSMWRVERDLAIGASLFSECGWNLARFHRCDFWVIFPSFNGWLILRTNNNDSRENQKLFFCLILLLYFYCAAVVEKRANK